MSLFKKRKNPNIRNRMKSEDDNFDLDEDMQVNILPGKEKEKKKIKKDGDRHIGKPSLLSFEDDLDADDGEVFQERKSALSIRMRKELKKERKEKKKEEKKKYDNKPDQEQNMVPELDDLGIKIVNGREAEALHAEEEDRAESEDQHKFTPKSLRALPKTPTTKAPSVTLDPVKKMLQSGVIPDANIIHEIRKQRQRARELGNEFPPTDDTVRVDESKSRLVREDENDHSEEDDEENTKIDFSSSSNHEQKERKRRLQTFQAAQEITEEGNEHDEEAWLTLQMKKSRAAQSVSEHFLEIKTDEQQQQLEGTGGTRDGVIPASMVTTSSVLSQKQSLLPSSASALPKPASYGSEGIIKRLKESRESVAEVARRHRLEADQLEDELVTSQVAVSKCSSGSEDLSHLFSFYQDMRGYVTDLRDCLNEKMCIIKNVEQQMAVLQKRRATGLLIRRRQDVKDQNDELSPFATAVAADEQRLRRAAEREGRRTRRRRERERRRRMTAEHEHHDGTSTDDEEPQSETNRLQAQFDQILESTKDIWSDVEDDFCRLECVMERFEKWKQIDPDSYTDAYVSLNLPKIFTPFIRLELLGWNPILREHEVTDVERMKWFGVLVLYGAVPADTQKHFKEDPDRNLISYVTEKVVLVKLKELIEQSWDPLSHAQTLRLVNIIRQHCAVYPTLGASSRSLKQLFQAVTVKIRDSIDNDVFIPMFPKQVLESSKTSGAQLFFQRQFWSAWKLLGSVLMWHNLLSESVLAQLAVRSILNLSLITALSLQADLNPAQALVKCRNVLNALPRAWLKHSLGGVHPSLNRLELFLVNVASNKLDPSTESIHLKECVELLRSMGAKEQAGTISDKYL